jgi:putative transposase
MSGLCVAHGISRTTGYKWLGHYREYGAAGLADHSSARLTHPPGVDAPLKAAILALRDKRPNWGPHKMLMCLSRDSPLLPFPAASTVGGMLAR